MCTNYVPSARQEIAALRLGVQDMPHETWPDEIYPGYAAPVLVRGEGDAVLCRVAQFGLIPRWCKDAHQATDISRKTYNARSETAAEKPSYRGPWHQRQWALAPMQSYFDPCWEDAAHNGGRAVRWQMGMADGSPFAVAGLWEQWVQPQDGVITHSFTLLTVNADGHAIMGRMHRPGDEKRMPVIIRPADYAAWLQASPQQALGFMQTFDARGMSAQPAPKALPVRSPQKDSTPQNLSLF